MHTGNSLAAALLIGLQAACITSWEPQAVTPAQAVASAGESELRLTLSSGIKVVLRDPVVEHDSLVGWVAPKWDSAGGPVRLAIAVGEVREVAVKKNDVGANVVLGVVAGSALFFGTIIALWSIACSTQGCD